MNILKLVVLLKFVNKHEMRALMYGQVLSSFVTFTAFEREMGIFLFGT
jgi:hypothetical protein